MAKSNPRKRAAAKPATPLYLERLAELHAAAEAEGDGGLTVYSKAGEDRLADLTHVDELSRMVASTQNH